MTERPWYREPETFIALAALVVSVSAVVVGIYEAALQRKHDRAEVWPHLEIRTFTSPQGATVSAENTGIGPAIIKSILVTVNDKPAHNWDEVLTILLGHAPATPLANSTIAESALRPGEKSVLVGIPNEDMPPAFWKAVSGIRLVVCYSSVFGESWMLRSHIGSGTTWEPVANCPTQLAGADF